MDPDPENPFDHRGASPDAVRGPIQAVTRRDAASSAAAIAPKFCPACGEPWQAVWSECLKCVARRGRDQAILSDRSSSARAVRSGIILYFAFLITGLASGIVPYALLEEPVDEGECIAFFVNDVAATLLVLVWCAASFSRVWPALRTRAKGKWFAAAAVGSVTTFAVAHAAVALLHHYTTIGVLSYAEPFLDSGYGWFTIVLSVCVQPAIVEELAFRGVIFGALERVLSGRDTVIVSSLMFMIVHLSVPSFPHLLLLGLAIGYLRYRSGSLLPGMLLHFLHNTFAVLFEAARM